MAYDVINWKSWFAKNGKRWSAMAIISGSCIFVSGVGTFLGCGIRSVTAKPLPISSVQTLAVGWLNFEAEPIQQLISDMLPNSTIEVSTGKIVIPPITKYDAFLKFSRENRDALELLRDVGIPIAGSTNTTPITNDQRKLVDTWVLASGFQNGASWGIALLSIGIIVTTFAFSFLIYIHTHKKQLSKLLSNV